METGTATQTTSPVDPSSALARIDRALIRNEYSSKDLGSFMQFANAQPKLSPKEEADLADEAQKIFERDDGTLNLPAKALFNATLRQVSWDVYAYKGYRLPDADMIQEGCIGLMTAIKRFKPDKGARLATYAGFWIRQRLNEHVVHFFSHNKIATTSAQRRLFFKLRSEIGKLGRRLGIEDAQAIADKYDTKLADVLEMEKRLLPKVAFEGPDDDDEGPDTSPAATLTADDGEHAEMIVVDQSVKDAKVRLLAEAFAQLDARESRIVQERQLNRVDEQVKTLKELGDEMGISAERARQLEERAMNKLKSYLLEHAAGADLHF